ncbi:MAG TPA: peptide deformylase [Bryobacteraceae bacterium]|nr:peptide deformylase [Bryobacteraceae bacterium]
MAAIRSHPERRAGLAPVRMMVYKVVRYLNNPILETPAAPVAAEEFNTPALHTLVEDMFETMYASHGIGLAAPQIDIGKRITVIDVAGAEEGQEPERIVLINPEVVSKEGKQTGEEGCLSIPGFREPVSRAKKTMVRAHNVKGETFEISGEDLLARAFLHEIDHLNGILFINHLSALKRDLIKRKIKKLQKAGEWE